MPTIFDYIVDEASIIEEATLNQLAVKQKSVTRLFPDFFTKSNKVPGVIAKGGVRMVGMDTDTWNFKIHSGTEEGLWYEATLRWKNIPDLLKKLVADRRLWNREKTKVDLKKLAAKAFKQADVELMCNCLTGDTRIPLLDGRVLTIEEILAEFGTDKSFWVYASDEKGDFIPAKAFCLGKTGETTEIAEVELDNGEKVRCTKDHLFRLRDGSYKMARDLCVGESLMPLYLRKTVPDKRFSQSYTQVQLNFRKNHWGRPVWRMVHTVVAETLLTEEKQQKVQNLPDERCFVVHHKNFDSLSNIPENLGWFGWNEHVWFHASVDHTNANNAIKKAWQDLEWATKARESNRKAGRICFEKHPELAEQWLNKAISFMQSEEGRKWASEKSIRQWSDPEMRKMMIEHMYGAGSEEVSKSRSEKKKAWWEAHPEAKKEQAKRFAAICKDLPRDSLGRNNHKVISVTFIELDEPTPVYDLSVENYQNFALAAGVYVHNCPADLYWGKHYIRSQDKYKAKYGEPENRPPDIRNPRLLGAYCKHLQVLMKVLPFYRGTMSNFLKRNYSDVISREEKKVAKTTTAYKKAAAGLGKRL